MAGKSKTEKQTEHKLGNINEEIVKQNVRKAAQELGACQCETCFANACAIVLNEIQPKYVTSEKGALLTEIMNTTVASQANLTVEATKAVMKVMKNPHH